MSTTHVFRCDECRTPSPEFRPWETDEVVATLRGRGWIITNSTAKCPQHARPIPALEEAFPLGEPTKPTPEYIEAAKREADARLAAIEKAKPIKDDKDQRFIGETQG